MATHAYTTADEATEIERLSRQWVKEWSTNFDSDDDQDRHLDEIVHPLYDRIASIPATNERDALWKVLVDSRDGEFGIEEETKAEVRRVLGLT